MIIIFLQLALSSDTEIFKRCRIIIFTQRRENQVVAHLAAVATLLKFSIQEETQLLYQRFKMSETALLRIFIS